MFLDSEGLGTVATVGTKGASVISKRENHKPLSLFFFLLSLFFFFSVLSAKTDYTRAVRERFTMAETICVTSSFSMYPEVHTSGESQIIMVTFRSVMSSLLNDYGRLLAHTDTNPSCPQCVRFLKKVNLVIFLYARTVGSQEILQLFVCCISTKNTMGVVLYTKPVARLQSEFPRV